MTERKFFGSDAEIIQKAHGLTVSQNTADWDYFSNQQTGRAYCARPVYSESRHTSGYMVYDEYTSPVTGDVEIEEYLLFDPERV